MNFQPLDAALMCVDRQTCWS